MLRALKFVSREETLMSYFMTFAPTFSLPCFTSSRALVYLEKFSLKFHSDVVAQTTSSRASTTCVHSLVELDIASFVTAQVILYASDQTSGCGLEL